MSDVEAGKAHVKLYAENSQFVKGLKAAESAFTGFGQKLTSIGSRMTGIGDAIGLTVGKEFAGKMIKTVAGLTLGAAIAAPFGVALAKVFKSGPGGTFLVELLNSAIRSPRSSRPWPTRSCRRSRWRCASSLGITSGVGAGWPATSNSSPRSPKTASTVVSIGGVLAIIGKPPRRSAAASVCWLESSRRSPASWPSPLGIVVAIGVAIAAGVAAWMRFHRQRPGRGQDAAGLTLRPRSSSSSRSLAASATP
jgi:hypothetical protein